MIYGPFTGPPDKKKGGANRRRPRQRITREQRTI
jgi:hypothetical protein